MRKFLKKKFQIQKIKKNKGFNSKKINGKIKKFHYSKYYLKRKSQKIAKNF